MDFTIKWKTKKYHTVGKNLYSNRKIVERSKIDTTKTQIHDCLLSWLSISNTTEFVSEIGTVYPAPALVFTHGFLWVHVAHLIGFYISASTGRNDFIFDIWLLHGDLYRASPFQVYRTSTSCLPRDL
jgi:hypothetical protein